MDAISSVLLGLAVPIIWGLVSAWAFDWLRERFKRNGQAKERQHRTS